MAGNILSGQTLTWAQPTSGGFQQSGAWKTSGQLTTAVPNNGTVAVFATGSGTPYNVSAVGQASQIQLYGDRVTFAGGYLGLNGAADPVTPALLADLLIDNGALLTIAAGEQLGGNDGVVIGESGTGTLVINGVIQDGAGTLMAGLVAISGTNATWRNNAALTINNGIASVTAQGVIATSGVLTIGTGGALVLDDTAQVQTNVIDLAGGQLVLNGAAGQAPLALATSILLAPNVTNTVNVAGGAVLINYGTFGAIGTTPGSLAVTGGGTLEIYGASTFAALDVSASTTMLEGPGTGNVTAGAGAVMLDRNAVLVVADGVGQAAVMASSGSDTVAVGAADTVMFGGTSPLTFITGGGGSLIQAAAGAATHVLVQAGTAAGQVVFVNGQGASTLLGGVGSDTVFAGVGGGVFVGGSAGNNALVASNSAATLVGGGSNDALYGSTNALGGALLFAGAGNESLVGGLGVDTMVGGSGATVIYGGLNRSTLIGGAGATAMVGRGQDLMAGGSGNDTLYGGPGNDIMIAGSGSATMIAGAGSATMVGGNTSNVYIGNSGTGTAFVFGGNGSEVYFTGLGNMDIVEGSGLNDVIFQSGGAAVFGGTGQDIYNFVDGRSGGTVFIEGFKQGVDQLNFFGYGSSAIAAQTVSNGSLFLTLGDGTNVDLLGINQLM